MTSGNSYALSLNSVFCATKSLCFAAGGFMGLSSLPNPTTGAFVYTYGTILVSVNGGTFWNVRSPAAALKLYPSL